ncbi:MAG: hypothetical protein SFW64_03630 [Alphaproteobacteria bacterium]|nr:hypothetical protein [Alphaproteobacteria bacterium]
MMPNVMPSQVVQTIETIFPTVSTVPTQHPVGIEYSYPLKGIVNLTKQIPSELLSFSAADYALFVLCITTIETQVEMWLSRGAGSNLPFVKALNGNNGDAITRLWFLLKKCPDEFPTPTTVGLTFISDSDIRDNIRSDIGAANRAVHNAEWKAATVLAGAAIEALLHWRLSESSPTQAEISTAMTSTKVASEPLDKWDLHALILVSEELKLIKPDTAKSAALTKNFRNLIHPGRAIRLNVMCDRGTAFSAIGAVEHVVRDLTP